MSDRDLGFLSALELRQLYRARTVSPVEVTRALLERIDTLQPGLNAFVTVTSELALQQATAAEALYRVGHFSPALAGIPISIKDLTPTKGVRTTRGSLLYADWVPDEDAPFVERVMAAGAVMLGKTNTPEFGWKGETTSRVAGSTHNPWQLGRTPGGSSGGGAAAVAAGLGPLAQGSDGAGSIRIPCSFCGLFGLKPSFGLVPQYPSSAVADLSHLGPMTRTVADAALLLNVVAGADRRDRVSWSSGVDYLAALDDIDITGLRVAWTPDLGYAAVEPAVRMATERAAQHFVDLGCQLEEAHPPLADPWSVVDAIWATGMAAIHAGNLAEVRDRIDLGRLAVIEHAASISGVELAAAYVRRNELLPRLADVYGALRPRPHTDAALHRLPGRVEPSRPSGGRADELPLLDALHLPLQSHRATGRDRAVRVRRCRSPHRSPDRRPLAGGRDRAAGGCRV